MKKLFLTLVLPVLGCSAMHKGEYKHRQDYKGVSSGETATVQLAPKLKIADTLLGKFHEDIEAEFHSGCVNDTDKKVELDGKVYLSTRPSVGMHKSIEVQANRPLMFKLGVDSREVACYRFFGFLPEKNATYVANFVSENFSCRVSLVKREVGPDNAPIFVEPDIKFSGGTGLSFKSIFSKAGPACSNFEEEQKPG